MKIKDINFENNLILAPMAGITDFAFRGIAIDYGADAGVTEMISAKAIEYNNLKTIDLLKIAPNEKIKIVQIFGHEPEVMANAIRSEYLQPFDIIDINMGCPAPKIVNNHEGSYLLTDIDRAEKIIRACVSATNKPITVKFRSGYDEDKIVAVEFAQMCERAGASAITIHPRTRTQMYSGEPDLNLAREVKNAVNIPVIYSGNIVDRDSLERAKSITQCDGYMIGRGALGEPEIFAKLLGQEVNENKYEIIERHVSELIAYYGERFVSGHIRKHLLWYLKGERNVSELKVYVSTEPDIYKCLNRLKEYFSLK